MTKQFYSVQELSQILGISRGAIYAAINRREIPALSVGARVLIPATWLEAAQDVAPDTDSPPPPEAS